MLPQVQTLKAVALMYSNEKCEDRGGRVEKEGEEVASARVTVPHWMFDLRHFSGGGSKNSALNPRSFPEL